jgi:hypothetical protein
MSKTGVAKVNASADRLDVNLQKLLSLS